MPGATPPNLPVSIFAALRAINASILVEVAVPNGRRAHPQWRHERQSRW
jgi:hypothetical protein